MYQQSFIALELAAVVVPMAAVCAALILRGRSRTVAQLVGSISAFMFAAAGVILAGALQIEPLTVGASFLRLEFGVVSALLLLAISFISAVVVCFSERYMSGERYREQFISMLLVLSCSSSCLVVSESLFLALLCWHLLSWGLWQTVRLQDGAAHSARTVLCHHLLSDFALFCGMILLWRQAAFDFSDLSKVAPSFSTSLIALLLVLSFSIKSALFPFHRWLLATLNGPTPLSGFLHAGVVNVSAVLAWRTMPVLQQSPAVMYCWGLICIASAVIGTLSMSARPDVKSKLVYSTVGQMGFMCLQCASGFVAAALFHLVAHGLFKCHMFLQSGSAVEEGLNKRKFFHAAPEENGSLKTQLIVLLTSLVFALAVATRFGECGWTAASATVTAAAVFAGLQTAGRMNVKSASLFWLLLLALGGLSIAGSNTFQSLLPPVESETGVLLPGALVLLVTGALFMRLCRESALGKALYAHSLSGFYAEEITYAIQGFSRGTTKLPTSQEEQ